MIHKLYKFAIICHLGISYAIQSAITPEETAIRGAILKSAVLASPANLPDEFDRIIIPEFDYCTFTADSKIKSNFEEMNRWNNDLAKLSVTSNKQSNMALDHPNTCLLSEDEIVDAIKRQLEYDAEEKRHKLSEKERNERQRNEFLEEIMRRERDDKARAEKEEIERKKKEELEKVNQSESKISIHIRIENNKFSGDEVNIWVLKPLLKHKYNKNKIAGQLGQLDEFNTNARM